MKAIQDFLKPRRGKIHQGYYVPKHPHKYIGDLSKIVFRSDWEYRFLRHCDNSDDIVRYASEPVAIPYLNPLDKRVHNYYIDFYIEMRNAEGRVSPWLIEVKPVKHTILPTEPKNPTLKAMENHIGQVRRVLQNIAKFKAADNYAKQSGAVFGVLHLDRTNGRFVFVDWKKIIGQ